jgi:hypothetical protein
MDEIRLEQPAGARGRVAASPVPGGEARVGMDTRAFRRSVVDHLLIT